MKRPIKHTVTKSPQKPREVTDPVSGLTINELEKALQKGEDSGNSGLNSPEAFKAYFYSKQCNG